MEKIFFMNTIMSWRETKKKGHGYKMSNLLKKFKVWNWKKFFVIVNRQKIVFFFYCTCTGLAPGHAPMMSFLVLPKYFRQKHKKEQGDKRWVGRMANQQ